MIETTQSRHERWRLGDLLRQYPTLRIVPTSGDELVVAGKLSFHAAGPDGVAIADEFRIELSVPPNFPRSLALVRDTGDRIPRDYHKLEGGYLCLGTPTEQRLVLAASPTLPYFVSRLVVPYLYGYCYFTQFGTMPFGEEDHGNQGIRDHLSRLYNAPAIEGVEEFLRLTSLKKRCANKLPCPCRSGRRLGRCHNRTVNRLRRRLGAKWFREEYVSVCVLLGKRRPSRRLREVKPPTLRETLDSAREAAPRGSSRADWFDAATGIARSITRSANSGPATGNVS